MLFLGRFLLYSQNHSCVYLHLGHIEVRPVDVVEVADLPLLPSYLDCTNVDIQLVCSQGRILHKLSLNIFSELCSV